MSEVTVGNNLRSASGDAIEVQASYASTTLGTVPEPETKRRIPLTDGNGHLHQHQMPDYLQPENLPDGITPEEKQALVTEVTEDVNESLTPPIRLTLLFENALA